MKILLVAALTLSLSACATTNVPTVGTNSTITQIQSTAVQICGYLPAVETVAGILATFTSGGASVLAAITPVADAICGAVHTKGAVRGKTVHVNGVAVHGHFVR